MMQPRTSGVATFVHTEKPSKASAAFRPLVTAPSEAGTASRLVS